MPRYPKKPKVDLIAILHGHHLDKLGPEELSVYGAKGCFAEGSSKELFIKDRRDLTPEDFEAVIEKILKETSGRGHGAVLDQNCFAYVLEDAPRLVTLQLCLPEYLMHLQQSLRRADANRGFYLPPIIRESGLFRETVKALNEAFSLYEKMQKAGVPGEDARFVLPLFTRTNIQTTGNARELMHLHHMSRQEGTPSIVRETVEEMIGKATALNPRLFKDRGTNYEVLAWFPSSQLFALHNKGLNKLIENTSGVSNDNVTLIDHCGDSIVTEEGIRKAIERRDEAELANLKHVHYTFLIDISLAGFHQAIRQRTWNQSVESIYRAVERRRNVTPRSINSNGYGERYENLIAKMFNLYDRMVESGIPKQEAIGVIPHSLSIFNLIHVNGWNAIHSIGKRTCTEAQWEIRGIAREMAEAIQEKKSCVR